MKIGIQELLVVFVVALIVVGPDKLPYYAKKLGQAFSQFRKYTEEATKDIRESVVEPLNEAQKPLREAMAPVTELERDVRNNVNEIKKSLADVGRTPEPTSQKTEDAHAQDSDRAEEARPSDASSSENDCTQDVSEAEAPDPQTLSQQAEAASLL